MCAAIAAMTRLSDGIRRRRPLTRRCKSLRSASVSQEQRDDKKHGAYSPLTEHEIEVLREEMLADDGFLPEGKGRVARLCDMAVNLLFYAQEIQWLRAMPSAGVALSA